MYVFLQFDSFLGGNRLDNLREVNKYVLHKFKTSRECLGVVHEMDLRRWAVEKSREVDAIFFLFEKVVL